MFEGVLRWNEFEAMVEITVERLWAWGSDDGTPTPVAVKLGGAAYAVEVIDHHLTILGVEGVWQSL